MVDFLLRDGDEPVDNVDLKDGSGTFRDASQFRHIDFCLLAYSESIEHGQLADLSLFHFGN